MATVSTVGSLSPDVSRSLFKAVDRNGDRQISVGEFTAFLNRFIGELTGGHSTGGLGSAAPAIGKPVGTTPMASPLAPTGAAGGGYAQIPGFDFGKLTDITHDTAKYTPAVRAFSRAIAAGNLPSVSSSLPAIVAYAQANGFPDAKVVKDDSIDFGDGHGAIDVITSVGGPDANWWFNNQPEQGTDPAVVRRTA